MYQALYRKYRPKDFNDVVGQKVIIETLKNAINNSKISHAYLFTGPRGTGKTSIAKILAKTVNCQNIVDAIPCCKCVNCTQIENKQSTDIIEIDAASNNGVDEIREIRNKVSLVPSTGKYKVYIIDEVHMLTSGAFNALLKTLEEPPSHIIFVLATTEPYKIPATILSRCQRFDFKKISNKEIFERLKYIAAKENINISDEAMYEIANISDGGLRDAINLLDQVTSYQNGEISIEDIHKINGSLSNQIKFEFLNSILDRELVNVLQMIDNFNDDGKNLIKIVEEIALTLKDILLLKTIPGSINKAPEIMELYDNVIKKVEINDVIGLLERINNELNNIKIANDPKLAIELMMIKECTSNINKTNTSLEKNNTVKIEIKEEKIKMKEEKVVELTTMETVETKTQKHENKETSCVDKQIELMEQFKARRIENALSRFDKKLLKTLKDSIKEVEEYIIDDNYTKLASLINDGELKIASDEYLVFVYDTEGTSFQFNTNTEEIEEFLEKIFKSRYRAISINNISWEIIKKEFNSKTKEYLYVPEEIDANIFKTNQEVNNELKKYFENIIEYE